MSSTSKNAVKQRGSKKPSIHAQTIHETISEIIAEERQKERNKMSGVNVKIRALNVATNFQVEIDLADMGINEIEPLLKDLMLAGYAPIVYNAGGKKTDNAGKKGTVKSVGLKEGKTNQWEVVVTIDGAGNGEQKLTAFQKTAFRVGDRVRLERNTKGFYDGIVLDDESDDTGSDDIPF